MRFYWYMVNLRSNQERLRRGTCAGLLPSSLAQISRSSPRSSSRPSSLDRNTEALCNVNGISLRNICCPSYFSISSRVSGIFLFLVSGRKTVMAPEVMAMAAKMTVGMAGWMSARAATVVDKVPPTLDTSEEEPTPAALTVVGINSPVHNILRNIPTRIYKLILIFR